MKGKDYVSKVVDVNQCALYPTPPAYGGFAIWVNEPWQAEESVGVISGHKNHRPCKEQKDTLWGDQMNPIDVSQISYISKVSFHLSAGERPKLSSCPFLSQTGCDIFLTKVKGDRILPSEFWIPT